MEFGKSLQEKLGEHEPHEVDELILDDLYQNIGNFTNEHKKTLESYKNLIHLSLNGLGLKSLTNFPKLPCLQIVILFCYKIQLEIRQNELDGSDFKEIKSLFPNLYKVKVGENPIKSIEAFKVFSGTQIRKLELIGTPAAKEANYREELFKNLKNVEAVDSKDKEGEDVESTIYDEEGDEFDDEDFEGGKIIKLNLIIRGSRR